MKYILATAALLIPLSAQAQNPMTKETCTDEADCLRLCDAEVRALTRQAIKRSKLIPYRRVPRDLWRVLPDADTDCTEEGNNDKLRIRINWVKNCLKNIKYYAKGNKLPPGPCWRDKKYFCAVYPQSDACENFPADWDRRLLDPRNASEG
jgi:hypothetical protein